MVPSHYNNAPDSQFYLGLSRVVLYLYKEIEFYGWVTQAERNADFVHGTINVSNRHNFPLKFGIPDGDRFGEYVLGHAG
jgi:hypothetical protein